MAISKKGHPALPSRTRLATAKVNEGLPSRRARSRGIVTVGLDMAVMVEQRNRSEATADLPDEFEWVNAWATQTAARAHAAAAHRPAQTGLHATGRPELAVVAGTDVEAASMADVPADFARDLLLAGDIIDIAEARDALLADASPPTPQNIASRLVEPPVGLARTADSVPIILGSVLGFLMVLVFATAAVFVRLAR
jgi:hypothetical protein